MPPPPPPRPPSPLPPPLRPQPSGDIGSGGRQFWTEADSLLPDTPLASSSFELGGGGVTAADARRARLALYCSHALSTWGQRGWEFTAGLVMFVIHPSSLLLVAVFGLCDAGAQVALGPAAGAYVDRAPRLRAACSMYVLQNASVAVSAGSCLALLWGAAAPPSTGFWALVGVAVAAGCLSSVGSLGAALSVEREWTRALSGGSSEQLAQINAGMKAIDLTCLLASPIAAGLLLRWRPSAAVGAALAWALAAWAPQCALLARAQAASPALLQPPHPPPAAKLQAGPQAGAGRAARLARGWAVWAAQPTALAALSLALLYLTVLSMGSLMTAYLYSRGMHEAELAAYRGLGAVSGLLATRAFAPLVRSAGLVRTGAVAVLAQLACLALGVLPQVALGDGGGGGGGAGLRVLAAGLVASRFGLWLFDLAVNQLIQEGAAQDELGAVSGAQASLQSLFQMLAYGAGAAVWQPARFPLLMAGSLGAVAAAAALFAAFAVRSGCGVGNGLAAARDPVPMTP